MNIGCKKILPLPKEFSLKRWVFCKPENIIISLGEKISELEGCAAKELKSKLTALTGIEVKIIQGDFNNPSSFKFILGTPETNVSIDKALKKKILPKIKHMPQQYYISSKIYKNDRAEIFLIGYDNLGAYYAAKTFCQLLSNKETRRGFWLPVVKIIDWPDLEERGHFVELGEYINKMGGADFNNWEIDGWERHIDWMSERKLNYLELQVLTPFGLQYPSKRHPELVEENSSIVKNNILIRLIPYARSKGVNIVPSTHHLDYLNCIVKEYPHLEAEGNLPVTSGDSYRKKICFSMEGLKGLFSDIFEEMIEMFSITDISVWLSESDYGCRCKNCRNENEFIRQIKVMSEAFKRAKNMQDVTLRFLTTQGSALSNNAIIFEGLPKNVKICHYDGGGTTYATYTLENSVNLISPDIKKILNKGYWMSFCTNYTHVNWHYLMPGPYINMIRERISYLVDSGFKGLIGPMYPSFNFYLLNLSSIAEFSWNTEGRTTAEFIEAWAQKEGYIDDALDLVEFYKLVEGPSIIAEKYRLPVSNVVYNHIIPQKILENLELVSFEKIDQELKKGLGEIEQAVNIAKRLKNNRFKDEVNIIRHSLLMMQKILYLWRSYEQIWWYKKFQGTMVVNHVKQLKTHKDRTRLLLRELNQYNRVLDLSWGRLSNIYGGVKKSYLSTWLEDTVRKILKNIK